MKKFMRFMCMALALSLVLAMPAYAENNAGARGSIFFSSYATDLEKVSSTSFLIWFDVDSNAVMLDVLGVSEIIVYRSTDQQTWKEMKVYEPDDFPEMTSTNAFYHTGYVTYSYATPGCYYRAYITFYAEDSRGVGERYVYTEILRL